MTTQNSKDKQELVLLDPPFIDHRGIIQNILSIPIGNVAIIKSKAGTIRSNHYHKKDWHYLYVVSGSMKYYERKINDTSKVEPIIVTTGQMIFTPPMMIHKTEFIEDTIMISIAKDSQKHDQHEEDIVREKF
jgi:dTDP-4-dehydrorhamnose 3,5-epimerase-like enzyme